LYDGARQEIHQHQVKGTGGGAGEQHTQHLVLELLIIFLRDSK
jgi:hypothetical protein